MRIQNILTQLSELVIFFKKELPLTKTILTFLLVFPLDSTSVLFLFFERKILLTSQPEIQLFAADALVRNVSENMNLVLNCT